ncbi:MAG: hypothetical protein H7A36_05570 [Chlamydiales bacterium]|nr:hypothetical protein [Chlamydiales bacterium]
MKKLFMTMLAVLSCGATYALPVGNPSEASLLCDGIFWEGHCGDMCDPCLTWCDAFSLRVGFWGDYQFNRYMETNTGCSAKRDVDVTRITTNAGYIAGNFWDRFDIFGTLGTTQIDMWGDAGIWSAITPGTPANTVVQTGAADFHMWTTTDFSWSIGVRGTIWECGCTSIGAEFQYLQSRPDLKFFDLLQGGDLVTGNASAPSFRTRQAFGNCFRVKYYDWQIGLGISHRINMLVPYAAIRWNSAKIFMGDARLLQSTAGGMSIPVQLKLEDLNSIKAWGYAVGVSLVDCEKMSLTAEGGFASSLEFAVNGQIRF